MLTLIKGSVEITCYSYSVMPVSVNEKTRRMRSQTDASQHCLAQFAGAHFNKGDGEWFITPGSPELTHSVQPAASSVPSEQPDS